MADEGRDYRIAPPAAFLPLNDDVATVTTRGQRLPSLLQSRSTTSLFDLPKRVTKRRGSYDSGDEERGPRDSNELVLTPSRRMSTRNMVSEIDGRRATLTSEILNTPQMRSMRLIGISNPRYRWYRYYKPEEELKKMRKPIREYYERNNYLIAQYLYIDRLLDSSLPHDLIREYDTSPNEVLPPIQEESTPSRSLATSRHSSVGNMANEVKIKRTPKNLYKLPDEASETSPLLAAIDADEDAEVESYPDIKYEDEDVDTSSPVVTVAIYINLAANILLLAGKTAVIVLTSSLSVLASLVDAALDFLSTAIVWTTTFLIARQDPQAYPIGRRRLEPVGVLVFSVVIITSFFQVGLECFSRLTNGDHTVVELSLPSIIIMLSTVVIKGFCWFWCRLVKNSSVQALAQDAITDVVFNIFSIIFPLVGFYAKIWWLDALGGLLLSFYVIFQWSRNASEHVRNLCGAAATADERNVLLYLTMRFAKTIKYIQGLQAYHAGDKLNVEVDIVLDEKTSLRDSHDLSESLQYVLESVPIVDRAFVHADYKKVNLPSHMNQQSE